MPVLFSGWLDHPEDIAKALGIRTSDPAILYAAAVEAWGLDAERRITGRYAAILCQRDGTVRLSRSPWAGKPLFFHAGQDVLLACTIPRPIIAAGLPQVLRQDAVDALLSLSLPDEERSAFEGIETLPHGSVLTIGQGARRLERWYDPLAIPDIRLRRDGDYVEAANELLAKAVASSLRGVTRPGIALSGGLDSAMVADEILRQMPAGRRLESFTFEPLADWRGPVAAHKFASDRPWVEAFAATHPGLDPHFTQNRGIAFDDRAEQLFVATGAGYPARVSGSVYHGVYDAAREYGCDWVSNADSGNLTFSNGAPWAWGEFLRHGHWGELCRMAMAEPGDPRPVWRRIAARAVMPELPPSLQLGIRRLLHGQSREDAFANPLLAAEGRLGANRRESAIEANVLTVDRANSRESYIRRNYHSYGLGGEIPLGYEQVFGVRLRDVTCYRPLIEFCLGLPTDQFVHDGETRRLARRMAIGRMPEAQRVNRLYGDHNVDWHARLAPRREELHKRLAEIGRDPMIGPLIDLARAKQLLDTWPDEQPASSPEAMQLQFYLPALIYIGRYVACMTGRNLDPGRDEAWRKAG